MKETLRQYIPFVDALQKIRDTKRQVEMLNRKERLLNLRQAFSFSPNADIAGKTVVVIDDVTTTGATFEEARRTLLQGNPKDNLRTIRRAPLDAALATNNQQAAIQIVQEMSPEEVAALGPNTINNVNLHSAYTVNMLKRMAVKMSTRDIGSLRSLLTPAGSAARADTRTWLNSQNGLENFS
jgi:hypothetical protein